MMQPHAQPVAGRANIERGVCYVVFAYDAARSVNLTEAERRIQQATERPTLLSKRRTPSYFEYQPPPLRMSDQLFPVQIATYRSGPVVDLMVYDFGAVTVTYNFPVDGAISDLLGLSEELYDNAILLNDSRQRVIHLVQLLGGAASQPGVAAVVEDYVIYHIQSFSDRLDEKEFFAIYGRQIAHILRAESAPLSADEIADALAVRSAYGAADFTVIDWNAAFLIDREGEDIRAVLDFANVELLEMRYLDQRLDNALDQAYDALTTRSYSPLRLLGYYGSGLKRVAELQVDNAVLFEGVNNTLKLLGDQYLARVYRLGNRRFHLDEWDRSILRKLQTLESIYEKISDQAAARRMEFLEWIIILLIAFSIALEFIH